MRVVGVLRVHAQGRREPAGFTVARGLPRDRGAIRSARAGPTVQRAKFRPGSFGGAPRATNRKWASSIQVTLPTIGGWSGGDRARTSSPKVDEPRNSRALPRSSTDQVKAP